MPPTPTVGRTLHERREIRARPAQSKSSRLEHMRTIDPSTESDTIARFGHGATGTDVRDAVAEQDRERAAAAVAKAEALLRRSHELEKERPSSDRKKQGRLHALIIHESLAHFTRTLTDEIARIRDSSIAGRRFASVAAHADTSVLGRFDRWQIRLGAVAARVLPKIVMPPRSPSPSRRIRRRHHLRLGAWPHATSPGASRKRRGHEHQHSWRSNSRQR